MKMRERALAALLLCACVSFTGCAELIPPKTTMPPRDQAAQSQTVPTQTAETQSQETQAVPTQMEEPQMEQTQAAETAATEQTSPASPEQANGTRQKMLAAYKKAMNRMIENMVLPVGTHEIELWDNAPISDEHFALVDVTGDGVEELLVSISNTYTAGMCTQVCGYDPGSDEVKALATVYISSSFYSDGWIKADASHNHGMAGEVMWPYDCYRLGEDGTYQYAFSMDAWDKALFEKADWDENVTYPQEYDPENVGAVYLKRNFDTGDVTYMTQEDYNRWKDETFQSSRLIEIPWVNITPENIGALLG